MINLRRANDRGHAEHGWLDSHHTFSFADYYDEEHMGFRALRVINDDRVVAGQGFPTHPHRDMEIITYVLEGGVAHKDSMGNEGVIRPGEVQRMTAGTGIRHSEFNASKADPVHLLQIWIEPEKANLKPSYEQKMFPPEQKRGRLRLVGSHDGRDGSVQVHQDIALYAGLFKSGEKAELALKPGRHAWVHVANGELKVNGTVLKEGDAAAFSEEDKVVLEGAGDGEVLVFDLG